MLTRTSTDVMTTMDVATTAESGHPWVVVTSMVNHNIHRQDSSPEEDHITPTVSILSLVMVGCCGVVEGVKHAHGVGLSK